MSSSDVTVRFPRGFLSSPQAHVFYHIDVTPSTQPLSSPKVKSRQLNVGVSPRYKQQDSATPWYMKTVDHFLEEGRPPKLLEKTAKQREPPAKVPAANVTDVVHQKTIHEPRCLGPTKSPTKTTPTKAFSTLKTSPSNASSLPAKLGNNPIHTDVVCRKLKRSQLVSEIERVDAELAELEKEEASREGLLKQLDNLLMSKETEVVLTKEKLLLAYGEAEEALRGLLQEDTNVVGSSSSSSKTYEKPAAIASLSACRRTKSFAKRVECIVQLDERMSVAWRLVRRGFTCLVRRGDPQCLRRLLLEKRRSSILLPTPRPHSNVSITSPAVMAGSPPTPRRRPPPPPPPPPPLNSTLSPGPPPARSPLPPKTPPPPQHATQ